MMLLLLSGASWRQESDMVCLKRMAIDYDVGTGPGHIVNTFAWNPHIP
jgi:hypothetical protein